MKKLFVALAAVAMTAGFAAKADDTTQVCNNGAKCDAPCEKRQCAKPDCPAPCPFDNLNLTDAQKEQFKALKAKKDEARKAQKQDKKAAKTECRRAELAEIKAILTPEQYVQFLENNYVDKSRNRAMRHPGMRPDGPRKEFRKDKAVAAKASAKAAKELKAERPK